MLYTVLIIGSIIGLVAIFWTRLKETRRNERVKVKVTAPDEARYRPKHGISLSESATWKKRAIDYKAVHEVFQKADIAFSKNDIDEAHKGFVQVLSLHPDHIESNQKLGLIYIMKKMPSKAEAIFRKLVEMVPTNGSYHMDLGMALYDMGLKDEAKSAYERAVSLDPRSEEVLVKLGYLYRELGLIKPSINAFSRALEVNLKNPAIYFEVAEMLVSLMAYEEALAYLESLLEVQPYNEKAKKKITEIRIAMGENPLKNGKVKNIDTLDQQQLFR